MEFNERTEALAAKVRGLIQNETTTIDQAEGVAILAWLSFIVDHADRMGLDPLDLARRQLEAFLGANELDVVVVPVH